MRSELRDSDERGGAIGLLPEKEGRGISLQLPKAATEKAETSGDKNRRKTSKSLWYDVAELPSATGISVYAGRRQASIGYYEKLKTQ